MNAIEIDKLSKYYGKARGICEVSFSIPEGEIFGFIGPNGAGKSTTIRTLLNLIHPSSGSARIFGMNCFTEAHKIKKIIGYLPSEVNYYDDMKVGELLKYSAEFYKMDCSKRIKELAEIFQLDLNKKIDALSYGNKKKTAIIQALLHEPKLLILDEPTGGLDPLMQNEFFEVLKKENEKGVTIFFSSHILSEVEKMCNRVAIVKEGKILKVEEIERLKSSKFKKVKLEAKNIFNTDILKGNELVNLEIEGKVVEFIFKGDIEKLLPILSEIHPANLIIEEPSLEEIFMHYYEKE